MQTNSLIPGILILENDSNGYVTRGNTAGALLTTAGYFATGCVLVDTTTAKQYINTGTVAVPVWNSTSEVTSAEIDPLVVQVAQVPLTAAQINGMYATPVVIVPAVTGKAIVLDDLIVDLTGTATQFAGGGVVNLQYKATANGAGAALHADIAAATVTGATTRFIIQRSPLVAGSAITTADIISQGVYISNKSGAFTTGTGTSVVTCRYHLV